MSREPSDGSRGAGSRGSRRRCHARGALGARRSRRRVRDIRARRVAQRRQLEIARSVLRGARPSLSCPYLDSTVSNEMLAAMSTLLPLACIVLAVSARVKLSPTRVGHAPGSVGLPGPLSEDVDPKSDPVFASRVDAVRALMFEIVCYCQALALTMGTYNALKSFVGRLRPNFFAACDYKGYKPRDVNRELHGLPRRPRPSARRFNPLPRGADVDEASLSFPSGHAGLSFVAMTWSTMALIRALSVERAIWVKRSARRRRMFSGRRQTCRPSCRRLGRRRVFRWLTRRTWRARASWTTSTVPRMSSRAL